MQARMPLIFALGLVAAVALAASDADAAKKKKRTVRSEPVAAVAHDDDGTPIIMQGFRRTRPAITDQPAQRADRPVHIPRGSSTYISPPVPSPNSPNSPPGAVLLQMPRPAIVMPPPTPSFSDRATNAIHDFPLQQGLGNNPNDLNSFIRQRANQ